jgi:PKD repeat protein
MRKNLLLGALAVFGMFSTVYGQEKHFNCGNAEQLKKLYAAHPELEDDYYHLLHKAKMSGYSKSDDTTIYNIPIVFHILHEYGGENISDAQVYDAVEILNEDYSNTNPDAGNVVDPFDTIVGTAKIKFTLARFDPYGNCTNGIEHIYTHMANKGDDYSKLHQWNRKEYLNIWVTNTIGSAGVAGYAYYPSATEGNFFFADGIIILNDYIGSIGTGSPNGSRALTHEIGHYLGLAHTWGSNNDNNVACGDDQVNDTPETKGSPTGVCVLSANTCDDSDQGSAGYWTFNVIDNVQNYMDYSYCSLMFSRDQVELMRNNLNEITGFRNNLWTDSNLVLTGANLTVAPLCVPIPDFSVNENMVCIGDAVTFQNASYNATVDQYEWTFPGGTPATSTAINPVVTYATEGFKQATLKVTNAAGNQTKTVINVVYVSPNWVEHNGPFAEAFDGPNPDFWISNNPENNHAYFHKVNAGGKDNSSCYVLNNYKDVAGAAPFSDDYFYYDRLGFNKDQLTTAAYNLSNTTGVTVSFDYAYGTRTISIDNVTEKLVVSSSKDCGKTWTPRLTVDLEDLLTVGYVGDNEFIPNNNNQYKTESFNYTTSGTDTKTRFRFEFTSSDYSSNLYIDNFNVSGTLAIEENEMIGSVSVSPNPIAAGSDLAVQVDGMTKDMVLEVMDVNGAIVATIPVPDNNGTQLVNVPMNFAKGYYLINAIQGSNKSTHRVVVY